MVDVSRQEIKNVLDKGRKTILLLFDGWDEYAKQCKGTGASKEIEDIVQREARQNFNLILTTRTWKSDTLLNVPRLGFKEVSIYPYNQ